MKRIFKNVCFCMLLIIPVTIYAQTDVTRFLDIPVDGFKPEMIKKLRAKGFTINRYKDDILDGEFNGYNVNILFGTNNNKIWRVVITDANTTDETNIKIKFNNLIYQFSKNKRYMEEADSTITKYLIPKDENISYEITVNKKRYEAAFYQKPLKYDSLIEEKNRLLAKEKRTDEETDRLTELIGEILRASLNGLNKPVWFMINEDYGKYSITMYYDNLYNKANGEGL